MYGTVEVLLAILIRIMLAKRLVEDQHKEADVEAQGQTD